MTTERVSEHFDFTKALSPLTAPYVSIVVPAYNVGNCLERCLVSLVFQTLEDIEIIVVNDASTDNTQKEIDAFIQLFPNKVRCVVNKQNLGLSLTRKAGLETAKAPYILFVDGDDYLNGHACEWTLLEALSGGHDMVQFRFQNTHNKNSKSSIPHLSERKDLSTLLETSNASWCSYLFRTEFLRNVPDPFYPMAYEDAAVTPTLLAMANSVGFYERFPLYSYVHGRPGSIITERHRSQKSLDTFRADEILWQDTKTENKSAIAVRIGKRMCHTAQKLPSLYDYAVAHIQHMTPLLKPYWQDELPEEILPFIDELMGLPREISIPKRVFINGFFQSQIRDFELYKQYAEAAYLFNPEIVVLDEHVCDLSAAPLSIQRALQDGHLETVGAYFALLKIYEEGGIYLSPCVQLVSSFNRQCFAGAFFAAYPHCSVSPHVFGGAPRHPVIKAFLNSYKEGSPYFSEQMGLQDKLASLLVFLTGVHLDGSEEHGLYETAILSVKNTVIPVGTKKPYCSIDYGHLIHFPAGYIIIPEELFQSTQQLTGMYVDTLENQRTSLRLANKKLIQTARDLRKERRALKAERNKLKKQVNALQGNRIWIEKIAKLLPKPLYSFLRWIVLKMRGNRI